MVKILRNRVELGRPRYVDDDGVCCVSFAACVNGLTTATNYYELRVATAQRMARLSTAKGGRSMLCDHPVTDSLHAEHDEVDGGLEIFV